MFLQLTTSSNNNDSIFIPAFQELHLDFTKTEPSDLLNVNLPAFKFVSQERFNQTKYFEDICIAISKPSCQFKTNIISVTVTTTRTRRKVLSIRKGTFVGSKTIVPHNIQLPGWDNTLFDIIN